MVIRDLMDVMRPHTEYTATATFYESRPLNGNAGGVPFDFSYVEPRSRAYTRLFANVVGEDGNIAIRTDERLNIVPGKTHIRLPDGQLYIVNQVLYDYDKAPKQALRMFPMPIGVERLIRMIPVRDPWSRTE